MSRICIISGQTSVPTESKLYISAKSHIIPTDVSNPSLADTVHIHDQNFKIALPTLDITTITIIYTIGSNFEYYSTRYSYTPFSVVGTVRNPSAYNLG